LQDRALTCKNGIINPVMDLADKKRHDGAARTFHVREQAMGAPGRQTKFMWRWNSDAGRSPMRTSRPRTTRLVSIKDLNGDPSQLSGATHTPLGCTLIEERETYCDGEPIGVLDAAIKSLMLDQHQSLCPALTTCLPTTMGGFGTC
jgi:hypothetical protein